MISYQRIDTCTCSRSHPTEEGRTHYTRHTLPSPLLYATRVGRIPGEPPSRRKEPSVLRMAREPPRVYCHPGKYHVERVICVLFAKTNKYHVVRFKSITLRCPAQCASSGGAQHCIYLLGRQNRSLPDGVISTKAEPLRERAVLSHLLSEDSLGAERLLGRLFSLPLSIPYTTYHFYLMLNNSCAKSSTTRGREEGMRFWRNSRSIRLNPSSKIHPIL